MQNRVLLSTQEFLFTICLAYGGREIVDAVRDVAVAHAGGELPVEMIDTADF